MEINKTPEQELATLVHLRDEFKKSIHAATEAIHIGDQISAELNKAQKWSVFDLIGGGRLSNLGKHQHIDNALALKDNFSDALANFNAVSKNITSIQNELKLKNSTTLELVDFVRDSTFLDLVAQKRISDAATDIAGTLIRLRKAETAITDQLNEVESSIQTLQAELHND